MTKWQNMKVHFHVNTLSERAVAAKDALFGEARRCGFSVCDAGEGCDFVIALGGDGTLLRAVRHHPDIPVLGLNLGSLGYLATVAEDDFARALHLLADGDFRVAQRTMLCATKPSTSESAIALNEIVVMREMTGHAASIDLAAGERSVTRYTADGLVIATPTGSTAYSLAAGGPVLMPDTASLVVTPMNPHALGVRPLVVSDDVVLSATSRRRVNGVAERLGVYADGEGVFMLGGDETVCVSKAAQKAHFIELPGYDPYAVLSRKLGWSGSPALKPL